MSRYFEKKEITKKSKDISRWYTDVVLQAELADYAPVKGTMVIRPYGFALWERVQEIFNPMMQLEGVHNAYFPLLIPYSLLKKEKTHVKGFSPELAIVTHGGGEKLAEPLVVRPTSETIMYEMYAKWVKSWRDLPILINQWNNVVRWEKRTYLFLRTTEFLWQEGHTAHETEKEAVEMATTALDWYRQIYEDYYAIAVIVGIKSRAETFAGAKTTYTVEALMPDGKALQGATSHNLGQNFAKVFNISFQDKKGKNKYVWQTSWGLSTRSLGGLFLTHGDDNGLVFPPKIAPIKAVIIPILGREDARVKKIAEKVKKQIEADGSNFPGRVEIWESPEKTFGWKVNEAEIKGIPLTIPVGPKEARGEDPLSVNYRVASLESEKVSIEKVGSRVEMMLEKMQQELYRRAKQFLEQNTHTTTSYEQFKKIMRSKRGILLAFWCEGDVCEEKIRAETKATTRALPLNAKREEGRCIYCKKAAVHRWYFAQAY